MDYFDILDLKREPFSNSPDPDFFYRSVQHTRCLQQLELAIRLRRGLNVVIGDVGTGKTTLCRELIRRFEGEAKVSTCLMLDPGTRTESRFLATVLEQLSGRVPPEEARDEHTKEAIKQYLFAKGVEEDQTTVLLIDEGQKIAPACLELLREFLNFETNTHKLLQIVIFAQKEFDRTIGRHPNFADRINLRLDLNPLGFKDTLALIGYRIQVSGGDSARRLFSLPAMGAVFLATRGYPRRIIHLCHRILLALIIQNRRRAGWRLVRASARRTPVHRPARPWRWRAAAGVLVLAAGLAWAPPGWLPSSSRSTTPPPAVVPSPSPMVSAQTTMPSQAQPVDTLWPGRAARFPATAHTPDIQIGGPPPVYAAPSPARDRIAAATAVSMPARLGRLTVAPRQTLGQLIQMIYGRFSPAYLAALAEANPHIPDPDTLNVGDVIHFPALPAAVRPLPVGVWWVQLAAHRQLEGAVNDLQRNLRDGIAARMVPYWNPDEGMVFALVLTDCFYDRKTAETARHRMTAAGCRTAEVRSLWRDDTVFFSDPFQGTTTVAASHSQEEIGKHAR
jgi:general secretion pathway protein A